MDADASSVIVAVVAVVALAGASDGIRARAVDAMASAMRGATAPPRCRAVRASRDGWRSLGREWRTTGVPVTMATTLTRTRRRGGTIFRGRTTS